MFWPRPRACGLLLLVLSLACTCHRLQADALEDGSDMPSTHSSRLPSLSLLAQSSEGDEWQTDWPMVLTLELGPASLKADEHTGLALSAARGTSALSLDWRRIDASQETTRCQWILHAGELAKAGPGPLSLSVSSGGKPVANLQLRLVDQVAVPGPDSSRQGLRAAFGFACILNDTTEMTRVAGLFTDSFPRDPDSHTARGDAYAAVGNDQAASAAYLRAIGLWGVQVDPPAHLLRRHNAALRRTLAKAATTPYEPPSKAELQLFVHVREGDAAYAKANYTAAVRSYERALAQIKVAKLSQDPGLLEARLAEARRLLAEQKPATGGAK